MTLFIRMRGDLDSERVPGTFDQFVNGLNLAAAKGMQYIILEDENGNPMALNQQNILTVKQRDDDDIGMVG